MFHVTGWDPRAYGATVAGLLDGASGELLRALRPGLSRRDGAARLREHSAQTLFSRSRDPECAWGGLCLVLGDWQQAHEAVQEVKAPNGAYWHAILHRLEGDDWNAGYWLKQLRDPHPAWPLLKERTERLCAQGPNAKHGGLDGRNWSAERWFQFVERAAKSPGSPEEALAVAIQQQEWALLFDHCARLKE